MQVETGTAKPLAILDRSIHRLDMRLDAIDARLTTIEKLLQELLRAGKLFPYNIEKR